MQAHDRDHDQDHFPARPIWLRHHPRDWQRGTLRRDCLHDSAFALSRHPEFDLARVEFITQFLRSFDSHSIMSRVQRSIPLYFLVIFAFYLHHNKDPADPSSGLTLTALQELFAHGSQSPSGMNSSSEKIIFASPSRVKDMLAYARLQGMFSSVLPEQGQASAQDKRIRHLEPTPMLTSAYADWILGYLRGSAVLMLPPVSLESGSISSELTHTLFSYRVRAYMQDGFTTTERFPIVRQFMMRDHGYSTFLRLMQTVKLEDGQYVATASSGELAQYRGIARATVRNALLEAQAAGHLQADRGGNRVVLSPEFFNMAQHWFALEMLWMHSLMKLAVADQHQAYIA